MGSPPHLADGELCFWHPGHADPQTNRYDCPCEEAIIGRYVVIQIHDDNNPNSILSLCEVQVYVGETTGNYTEFLLMHCILLWLENHKQSGITFYINWSFLCRLRSIVTHRDHFVRRPSVCPSVTLSKAMFRRRHIHSLECCHYFLNYGGCYCIAIVTCLVNFCLKQN